VTIIGTTEKCCMLETTNLVTAQTTIILNMGSEALFSDIKLTRNLGLGTEE
jgi:hypothetical protein